MKHLGVFFVIVLLSCSLGCGQEEPKKTVSQKDVKQEVKEAAKTTKDYLAQQQQDFMKLAQDKLSDMDKKINMLQQKAEKSVGETQQKLNTQVDSLKKQMAAVKEKLSEMKGASGEAWEKLKSGMTDAFAEMEKAYKRAEDESN